MNAKSLTAKVAQSIAIIDTLIPHLTPSEHDVIARGIALVKTFAGGLPKERSEAAKMAMDEVLRLSKTVAIAHAPLVGLGDAADAEVAKAFQAAFAEAGAIRRAIGSISLATEPPAVGDGGK